MYGAAIGDIIGSPYEFDRGSKTKDFPLFTAESHFTDDTVMTAAVAEALLGTAGGSDGEIRKAVTDSMLSWGRRYPGAGYGASFAGWLKSRDHRPYGSYGNGSAMRASAAGWLGKDIHEARRLARLSAEPTHDHPEGIKGAESVAAAIFLARTGCGMDDIRSYIVKEFGYDLSRSCSEIRPYYRHVESCQETVPEALTAFFESTGFEDAVRNAVSLGGDCDTLACICASVAEAYYGIPEELISECRRRLPGEMISVFDRI